MRLSIILPVAAYNVHWLDRAIDSAIEYADELIVVTDDGCRFHPLLQNNPGIHGLATVVAPAGVETAINVGVAMCAGTHYSILCSDDRYLEGMARLKDVAAGSMDEVIFGQVQVTGMLGESVWPMFPNIDNLQNENCVPSPAIVRKDWWFRAGGYSDVRYTDYHFYKKIQRLGAEFTMISDCLFYEFNTHPGSIGASYGYRSDLGHEW